MKIEIPEHKFPATIDFNPFIHLLEQKYGWDYRDMSNSSNHFETWKNARGYGETDPEGKHWRSSQVWLSEYQSAEDGYAARPPYQDVWHWLIDHPFCELLRGGVNYLSIGYLENEDTPEYVRTVLQAIFDEVKDHPAFDGECVTFHIDW